MLHFVNPDVFKCLLKKANVKKLFLKTFLNLSKKAVHKSKLLLLLLVRLVKQSLKMVKRKTTKSKVNEAGNYTKPALRKRLFEQIKAGRKGGKPGQWSARKAQMLAKAYKETGGGYKG
jgi:hypothetical protein